MSKTKYTVRLKYNHWKSNYRKLIDFKDNHKYFFSTLPFILMELILFSFLLFYPAYTSYSDSIGKKAFLEDYLMEKTPGGYYIPTNDTIVLLENSSIILRHELCHRDYSYTHKNSTDDSFSQELECYIKEWFIWNKVNLTTLDYEK